MDTKTSHFTSERGLVLLTIIGFILLVTSWLAFFQMPASLVNTSVSLNFFTGLHNTTLTAQLVAMLFWSVLSFLGGVLWLQTFSRISNFVEKIVLSLVLSGFIIVLGALLPQLFFFGEGKMISAYTLMTLFASVFIAFLFFMGREILTATFSQRKN